MQRLEIDRRFARRRRATEHVGGVIEQLPSPVGDLRGGAPRIAARSRPPGWKSQRAVARQRPLLGDDRCEVGWSGRSRNIRCASARILARPLRLGDDRSSQATVAAGGRRRKGGVHSIKSPSASNTRKIQTLPRTRRAMRSCLEQFNLSVSKKPSAALRFHSRYDRCGPLKVVTNGEIWNFAGFFRGDKSAGATAAEINGRCMTGINPYGGEVNPTIRLIFALPTDTLVIELRNANPSTLGATIGGRGSDRKVGGFLVGGFRPLTEFDSRVIELDRKRLELTRALATNPEVPCGGPLSDFTHGGMLHVRRCACRAPPSDQCRDTCPTTAASPCPRSCTSNATTCRHSG